MRVHTGEGIRNYPEDFEGASPLTAYSFESTNPIEQTWEYAILELEHKTTHLLYGSILLAASVTMNFISLIYIGLN